MRTPTRGPGGIGRCRRLGRRSLRSRDDSSPSTRTGPGSAASASSSSWRSSAHRQPFRLGRPAPAPAVTAPQVDPPPTPAASKRGQHPHRSPRRSARPRDQPRPRPAAEAEPQPAATPDAPPPTKPEPSPVASGELTLEQVVAAWPDIVAWLSQKPAVKQLILTCRPVALDGAIVSLGFPEEQAFLRDVAERKKADIESGVAHVIGRDVGIRCVVANVEIAAVPASDESFLISEARRIFGEDLVDVGEVS